MKEKLIKKILFIAEAVLTSYSQVFFTVNKVLAFLLILVSFIDWWVGLNGLVAVLTAIGLSKLLNYSPVIIRNGLYSFNALLVGLGVGTYFALGIAPLVLTIIGSVVAFFITVYLMGKLSVYNLPFLSLPFLFAMWLLFLSFPAFSGIEMNIEALYPSNMFFKVGGQALVIVVDALNQVFMDTGFDTYFLSLGAIFFQFNILAGVIIAIGLVIHSRVNFLFSLIGFFVAYWFYSFLGITTESLNYTYYGFNFILSAIAIGGYFLIPSKYSLLWSLLLIPVLVVVTIGSDRLFSLFGLSVFSLPFNIVLIGVLYAFKIRYNQTSAPILTLIHQKNPETNAYLYHSLPAKKYAAFITAIRLPFMGEWTVNQGHNGKYTHKQFFQHAWDFVITDATSKNEFSNDGYILSDYFCFGKPVIAPASGTVVAVVNTIEDNEIGVANTLQNWGNTVVVKHEDYLFSKLSHLQKGTVKVAIGDTVQEGQLIAKCGNSGRSQYPHLHFQLQTSEVIGSPTLFWPLSEYVKGDAKKLNFKQKGIPKENDVVSNVQTASIIQAAFKWNPGEEFTLTKTTEDHKTTSFLIRNEIDIYNQSYLHCVKTDAKLYYLNNTKTFTAQNYIGSKKSALFQFYSTFYKIVFSERNDLNVKSRFPLHHLYRFPVLTIQDFLIPFGIFLKGSYRLNFEETEQGFNPQDIKLQSQITNGRKHTFFSSEVVIHKNRNIHINYKSRTNSKNTLTWENKLESY